MLRLLIVWVVLMMLILPEVGDFRVRQTVRVALLFGGLTFFQSAVNARRCWTLACWAYLVHVVVAFTDVHHGSHAEAFAHVQAASGFGAGIFVSYLFTLLWVVDVLRWWWQGANAWPPRLWLAFMAFITFNATVIYETGFIRWAGVCMFLALAGRYRSRRISRAAL